MFQRYDSFPTTRESNIDNKAEQLLLSKDVVLMREIAKVIGKLSYSAKAANFGIFF